MLHLKVRKHLYMWIGKFIYISSGINYYGNKFQIQYISDVCGERGLGASLTWAHAMFNHKGLLLEGLHHRPNSL